MARLLKSNFYEIEEILDKRTRKNKIEYLVKWSDHTLEEGESDRAWVPEDQCNCPTAIANFEKEQSGDNWEDEYVVEGIIDSILHPNKKISYLVKWKDFDVKKSTWVKEADMKNCKLLIEQFKAGNRYKSEDLLQVKKINEFATFVDGLEHYTITKMGEDEVDDNNTYSLDEIYVAFNGRKALNKFNKNFQ